MHSPIRVALLVVAVSSLFACGPAPTNYRLTDPNSGSNPPKDQPASNSGAACSSDSQCSGTGAFCVEKAPNGACTRECTTNAQCGPNGTCTNYGSGESFCNVSCPFPGGQSTCRAGYTCFGYSNASGGFCDPTPKAPVGAACTADSQCGTAACGTSAMGWVNGYCTKSCTDTSECGAGGTCTDFGQGVALCMANCASPGTQSTCRSGYSCRAFQGTTTGFCDVTYTSGSGGGAGSGSGGGAGGGSGSGGGTGGAGGGGSVSTSCASQCFQGVIASCRPSGSCAQQNNSGSINQCFSNGTKQVVTLSGVEVSNSSGVCYGITVTKSSGNTIIVYRGPSGVTLAKTEVADATPNIMHVTCAQTSEFIDLNACRNPNWNNTTQCVAGSCQ